MSQAFIPQLRRSAQLVAQRAAQRWKRPTASAAAPRMLVISSMSGTPYIFLYLPASPQILLYLPISQRMLAISRMSGSRIRTLAQSLTLTLTLHLSMAVTTTQPELPP